jgi:hypothetical protein
MSDNTVNPNPPSSTPPPDTTGNDGSDTSSPNSNLAKALAKLIDLFKSQYLDIYSAAAAIMLQFAQDIASFQATINDSIKPGSDSSHVTINGKDIADAAATLESKYQNLPLFTAPDSGDDGKAEATKWATEFGLDPATCVVPTADRTGYMVVVNLQPVSAVSNAYGSVNGQSVDAGYQLTGIKATADAQFNISTDEQSVFMQHTNRANSNYDSFLQAMSTVNKSDADAATALTQYA